MVNSRSNQTYWEENRIRFGNKDTTWKKLWSSQLRERLKLLLWRIVRNVMPTGERLGPPALLPVLYVLQVNGQCKQTQCLPYRYGTGGNSVPRTNLAPINVAMVEFLSLENQATKEHSNSLTGGTSELHRQNLSSVHMMFGSMSTLPIRVARDNQNQIMLLTVKSFFAESPMKAEGQALELSLKTCISTLEECGHYFRLFGVSGGLHEPNKSAHALTNWTLRLNLSGTFSTWE
ncbi:hypothetical protein PanWU01x14_220450, partial [Parasponia andersonii]